MHKRVSSVGLVQGFTRTVRFACPGIRRAVQAFHGWGLRLTTYQSANQKVRLTHLGSCGRGGPTCQMWLISLFSVAACRRF